MTYASMRHRVRVSLAGRGAEELVFGPEAVGHGAQEDLRKATELAGQAFARLGFAPAMGEEGQSASNLAVVGDEPTASEIAHVETLVRKFLATEYQIVLDMLKANRPLLDQLTGSLLEHGVLSHESIALLVSEYECHATVSRTGEGCCA